MEKRPDGAPLPEDLQEALHIIFPNEQAAEESKAAATAAAAAPEIIQQEPELETAPDSDDLRMLGIDEGDMIL